MSMQYYTDLLVDLLLLLVKGFVSRSEPGNPTNQRLL